MGVKGISGSGITGTLSDGAMPLGSARRESDEKNFMALVNELTARASRNDARLNDADLSGVSSSQVSSGKRINGDYTKGFKDAFTSEKDKSARPRGFAAGTTGPLGSAPVIDRTSELYEQSLEMENYFVKIMLSSMRGTIQKAELLGKENSFARDMYDDMLNDNYAEQITKSAGLGLADQIYIELSGQR